MSRWLPSISPYADWLKAEKRAEFDRWLRELGSADAGQIEGRAAEAVAWDWLYHRVDKIHPGLTSTAKSPDFRCRVGGSWFSVEVSNISRATMTELTGMGDGELYKGNVGSPVDRMHQAVLRKELKGRVSDVPYLIFVTTLHWNGSILLHHRHYAESLVTSTPFIQGRFDDTTGDPIGDFREVVDFKRSSFTESGSLTSARAHVSGVLIGPFGRYPAFVAHGVLHPQAIRPFDPTLLPETPFGQLASWPPSAQAPAVNIVWTHGAE